MFIMGMAFHILPRFKAVNPVDSRLVLAVFWIMSLGVLVRVNAQPHPQGVLVALLGASGVIEFAGVAMFAGLAGGLLLRSRERREPFDRFILASLAWLVVVAGINGYLALRAAGAGDRVLDVTGDAALLWASVYGFVLLFILGVSFRVLPFFLGLPPPHGRLRDAALVTIVAALAIRVIAVWAPAFGDAPWAANVTYASTFALAMGVCAAVVALRVFEAPDPNAPVAPAPSGFGFAVRAAYVWLLIGVALDVYWRLRELEGGFTPYYAGGAVRHAFLLGFATLMIMAIAYRTLPVFSGRDLPWPQLVVPSFLLVVAGAALRVFPVAFTAALADLDYKLMVTAGFLTFFGLAIFGAQAASVMYGWWTRVAAPALAPEPAAAEPEERPRPQGPVRGDMTVAEALKLSPAVLQVLIDYGFRPLADPETRERMAPTITIEKAAAVINADPRALIDTLNIAVAATAPRPPSRPGEATPSEGPAPIEMKFIDTPVSQDLVMTALKSCYDPEIPVNVVDLGLVYKVVVREAYVHVTMTLTAPGCPMADEVERQVREALLAVPGAETVDVDMVQEPAWTPERMSPEARAQLGWG